MEVGTVTLIILTVNRGRGNTRNIFSVNVQHGQIIHLYLRNNFDSCPHVYDIYCITVNCLSKLLLTYSQIIEGKLSTNKTATQISAKNNRRKCFKAKLKCISRCHGSLYCPNKQYTRILHYIVFEILLLKYFYVFLVFRKFQVFQEVPKQIFKYLHEIF